MNNINVYVATNTTYIVLQNPNLHDMMLGHMISHYNLLNINVPKAYTYTNNVKKTLLNTTNQDLKLSVNIHLVSGFTKV